MKLTKLSLSIVGCISMAAGAANAAGPTLSDVLGNSGITATGFIGAGYTYQTAPNGANAFAGSEGQSTFAVNQAALTLAKTPTEGWGGLINVTAGRDADWIKSYPYTTPTTTNGVAGSAPGNGFDVTQAYVQYASGPVTAQLGKFATLAGAEVIAPTGNTNITRSIAFFQLPYTHTGARVTYVPSSTVTLIAGVNNGWDQQRDANNGKTGELGLIWAPTAMISWALSGYYGAENYNGTNQPVVVPGGVTGNRTLVDSVITFKPTDKLTLILNTDYGQQKGTGSATPDYIWVANAAYANYQFTDKLRTSLRLEVFDDKDGKKIGLANQDVGPLNGAAIKTVSEATLTVGYAPAPSYELRAELRGDKADGDAYKRFGGGATDFNTTLAFEGLYHF